MVVLAVRTSWFREAVRGSSHRVLYDPPPARGLDPRSCDRHECFVVEPVVLLGERGIEFARKPSWFFEDARGAGTDARAWLESIDNVSSVIGAHAHVRHADVIVDPTTGRPTTQLVGAAPIIEVLEAGCLLDLSPSV